MVLLFILQYVNQYVNLVYWHILCILFRDCWCPDAAIKVLSHQQQWYSICPCVWSFPFIRLGPFPYFLVMSSPGLGFSHPEPVFPVQNGINWDKPGFPIFSCPKQGKTSKTGKKYYISSSKTFLKCDYQTKIEQDMLEDNLTKRLWAHNPKFVKKDFALILIQIIYTPVWLCSCRINSGTRQCPKLWLYFYVRMKCTGFG